MKMSPANTANILNYAPYSKNCNLGGCRRSYMSPVPSITDVQLYINFGTVKPTSVVFTIINLCSPFGSASTMSDGYIIAFNGSYWYGVFKNFESTGAYGSYLIAAAVVYEDTTTGTFFSEQYQNASSCDVLTKVSVCYPYNYNDEDLNGIYIGLPDDSQPVLGKQDMFYQHTYWVRASEIIETGNKISFTSNQYKNFNTELKKTFEFRPGEFVPGWYKDYLLAVYFRGQVLINNTPALVSDLAFENIDEASDQWKAYVVLGRDIKGAFGCADILCPEDCVCVPVSFTTPVFANAVLNVPYSKTIAITGDTPLVLSGIVKPAWMTITLTGYNLVFSGTPDATGTTAIAFTITNACGTQSAEDDTNITVVDIASYLDPSNYSGDYGAVTDTCTLHATFSRTLQAQEDAATDVKRLQVTFHILIDNASSLDVTVIFETTDVNVPQIIDASAGGVCGGATSIVCTSIIEI